MAYLVPSEHQEQSTLIEWCNLQACKYPSLRLIFAIPNGTNKSPAARAAFKREGLKSGVPDLFFPHARGGYFGLFIEMKRIKGSNTSENQKSWLKNLDLEGYKTVICYGSDQAGQVIKDYLKLNKTIGLTYID